MTLQMTPRMIPRGIVAYGSYLPAYRLSRPAIASAHAWANPTLKAYAKSARTMAYWDEDSITMAVEAGSACLNNAPDSAGVKHVTLASTSLPFSDRSNAGIVRLALGVDDDCGVSDVTGSQRAGITSLVQALKARQNSLEKNLIVASHKSLTKPASIQEINSGDGAAAILIGSEEESLAVLKASVSIAADLVDHYQATDSTFDYTLEDRWIRDEGYMKLVPEAVQKALNEAEMTADTIDHFSLQAVSPALEAKMAVKLGIASISCHGGLFDRCGYAGSAHPLLTLNEILDQATAGQTIMLVGFGQGVDVLILKTTDLLENYQGRGLAMNARLGGQDFDGYMQYLSFNNHIDLDWGMRAERDERTAHSVAYRKSKDLYAFIGGKCSHCGTQQFPRSNVCINPECRAIGTQEPFSFRGLGATVKTYTEDWQAFSVSPPLVYGNMAFDGGGNLFMEVTNCGEGDLSVGSEVNTVFRIKDFDHKRGFRRYFWKAIVANGCEDT